MGMLERTGQEEEKRLRVLPQSFSSSLQRIAAVAMPQALRYFGRSVDGRLDMDGDDLVDVAVGAHGAAILLR